MSYKIEITSINANANGKYFNQWIKDTYQLNFGVSYGTGNVVLTFDIDPGQIIEDAIRAKYATLTTSNTTLIEIIKAYRKKRYDGFSYFEQKQAEIYFMYASEEVTATDAFYIEAKLSGIKTKLHDGDWMSAQNEMLSIVIENAYTQEIHDSIKTYIDDYVTANY
jgi:hypothetical protein